MTRDEQFKETVLGWIREELDKDPSHIVVTTIAEDPFGYTTQPHGSPLVEEEPIIDLTEDMIIEDDTALFVCDKCLFHARVRRDVLESQYRMFCPRCDNTLFDEELKK